MLMTQEEYKAQEGTQCPCCASDDITQLNSHEDEGHEVTLDCQCDYCGAVWYEVYEFARFVITQEGKKVEDKSAVVPAEGKPA